MLFIGGGVIYKNKKRLKKISFVKTIDGTVIAIPSGYSVHHRKAQRYEGKTTKRNISVVLMTKHNAWNILFDNHETSKVAELLNGYWKMFGGDKSLGAVKQTALSWLKSLKGRKSICNAALLRKVRRLGVGRSIAKKFVAWVHLFDGLSFEKVAAIINATWIDPDYRIVVGVDQEIVQVKRAKIIAVSAIVV